MQEIPITLSNHGQQLVGMIHIPDDDESSPAVLMLHGFTGTRIESHFIFVKMARRMAEAGYFVMRFDFRGSGESEGEFREVTVPGEVDDAEKALAWLRQRPEVDPERVVLLGLSMGGCVAAAVAGEDERTAGLILWSAIADLMEIVQTAGSQRAAAEQPPSNQPEETLDFGGNLIGLPFIETIGEIKPLQSLQDFKRPVLIIHGTEDQTVPPEHAERYYQVLGPGHAELHWIAGADHTYSSYAWEENVFSLTLDWLRRKVPTA